MEASNIGTKHQPQTHTRGVRNDHRPQLSSDNPRKEDSVTISKEGRQLLTLREVENDDLKALLDEFRARKRELQESLSFEYDASTPTETTTSSGPIDKTFINRALEGKVENPAELMRQLYGMLSASPPARELGVTYFGDTTISELESQAAQREAGKKLAEYMAQNYFEDPDEAKAFMDMINKFANEYEKRDEERLDRWVNMRKQMEDAHAKIEAEINAYAAAHGYNADEHRTDPEIIKARLEQIAPEPDSESYKDAWQSLVKKDSSVHDWFANFIDKVKSSIKIEDLLGKYSNISVLLGNQPNK